MRRDGRQVSSAVIVGGRSGRSGDRLAVLCLLSKGEPAEGGKAKHQQADQRTNYILCHVSVQMTYEVDLTKNRR